MKRLALRFAFYTAGMMCRRDGGPVPGEKDTYLPFGRQVAGANIGTLIILIEAISASLGEVVKKGLDERWDRWIGGFDGGRVAQIAKGLRGDGAYRG